MDSIIWDMLWKGDSMIRKITEEDRDIYLELAQEFFASDAVLHNVSRRNLEATFDEMVRSDVYAEGYLIEWEGSVAGYGLLAKTFSQEAGGLVIWLEELYLRPQYRCMGLGKAYFAFIMDKYKEAARFRLEVEEDNARAMKLYEQLGYERLDYLQMICGE